jgi:hypothetical protein
MTIVTPIGGLNSQIRQRILDKLPSKLVVIARLISTDVEKVDAYFAKTVDYRPQTEAVKNHEIALPRKTHYSITILLHRNLGEFARILEEAVPVAKSFLESCFVRQTGVAFQKNISAPQTQSQTEQVMAARA